MLCITADVSFRTYINGNFVCQGPVNIGSDYEDKKPPEHWFFTTHDVKKYLQKGKNLIAIEVFAFDLALSETTSGKGKLICDLDKGLDKTILSTDSSWKCKLDTSFTTMKGGIKYEAAKNTDGWKKLNFDDSDWTKTSIQDTTKKNYLIKSRIPTTIRQPLEPVNRIKDSGFPDNLYTRKLTDESFTLDFGKNMSGYYKITLNAHKGDTVKILPKEKSRVNRPFTYICQEGKNYYTTPQLNVFRYLTVKINSQKGLKIDSLYAIYSSYPVQYKGSFSCSNKFYTKLWDITRWTTQMCMNDYFLDSPKHQEPIACTGDYLIVSLSNYYAFGDQWLTRQNLIKTAKMLQKNEYDMFHTSYSLLWIQMIYRYYQYTGDRLLVKKILPHCNKLNDLFESYLDNDHLVSQAPDYMFMDWINIGGFNAHHPPAVIGMGYLSAFYYRSLIITSYLNRICNNPKKARENMMLAEKIKAGINNILWDENKGLYKDGEPFKTKVAPHFWLPADKDTITYSPHINTLAVLYDIAPKSKQKSIMEYILHQNRIDLQPYFSYFVLSAISHINNFDSDGLKLLNKWKKGIDLGTYTLKENWQDTTEFGYRGDFSHAWGGSPLYFMSSKILGITPAKPGYKIIKFTPYVSNRLSWAKGKIPLINGQFVSTSWERIGDSKYIYQIEIPEGRRVILNNPDELDCYDLKINKKIYKKYDKQIRLNEGFYVIEYIKHD